MVQDFIHHCMWVLEVVILLSVVDK